MRVAVTAPAATPPRHGPLTPPPPPPATPPGTHPPPPPVLPPARHAPPPRPARPPDTRPGTHAPRRPIIPAAGARRQGRLRRRCASAARPCDTGHRPRDPAAITAMGPARHAPHLRTTSARS